jgi:hypothetical protein
MHKNSDPLNSENVTYAGIIWSALAIITYFSFNTLDGIDRPLWFKTIALGFEQIAAIGSGYLCWRNWRSTTTPNGRILWLLLAIGLAGFFGGNIWFGLWELVWGLDPASSVGNIFFVLFYLFTIAAIRLIISRERVRLDRLQWSIICGVTTFGIILSVWLTAIVPNRALQLDTSPVTPIVKSAAASQNPPATAKYAPPPQWAIEIDRILQPTIGTFNLFYVLCDLVLLILSAILLLGFWGGSLGRPWRVVAQAVLCFYVSDLWFAYANNQIEGYRSGFIMELFWIFGIVQFGIAAALEFDNALRMRRLVRRRTKIE